MANYELGNLIWRIKGDTKDYDKKIKSADTQTKKFGGTLSGGTKQLLKWGGAAAAAALSIGKIISSVKESVSLYGKQITAERTLAAAIEQTGENADELLPRYKDLASEIQGVTTEGDESTLALMQQAQALGINSENIEEATKGAIGLSKSLGIGTRQAIRGVANAFEGNFETLQRYIPALRNTEDESEKLAIVQKAMADGFEVAKAEADSGFGALQQYDNALGDLKEQMGESIVEGIEPLVGGLTRLITSWTENIERTRTFKEALAELRRDEEDAFSGESVAELERSLEAAREEVERLNDASGPGAIARARQAQEVVDALEAELEVKRRLEERERLRQQTLEQYGETSQEYQDFIKEQQEEELERQERLAEINRTAAEERQRIQEDYSQRLFEMEADTLEKIEAERQAALDRAADNYVKSGEEIELINEFYDRKEAEAKEELEQEKLEAQERALEEQRRSRQEEAEERAREREEELEAEEELAKERVRIAKESFAAINDIVGLAFDNRMMALENEEERVQQRYDAELAALQEKFDNEEISEEEFKKREEEIEKEQAEKLYQIQLAQFKANQKRQVYETIIATAQLAVQAYKALAGIPVVGPALGAAAAAAATAFGFQQVGLIQSQPEPPPPEFAEGGFVQPRPGTPETGDRVPARLNPREVVLTESDANELLSAIRGGGLGGKSSRITVNLDRKTLLDAVTKGSDNGEVIINSRAVR